MKVSEIMTRDVQTAQPDTTVEEIAALMKEEGIGSVPVLDEDGELAGIVTDRDIVVRCIAEGKDASETTVDEILSEDLSTIEPYADVREAYRLMSSRKIRRLPVVQDGELVGILSLGDTSVKDEDEQASGETLQEISQGVRERVSRPARKEARREMAARSAARPQGEPEEAGSPLILGFEDSEAVDLEFTDEEEVQPPDEKKIPKIPVVTSGRERQAASSRGVAKNKKKKAPARVVSIRHHAKAHSRKRGGSHRKTG